MPHSTKSARSAFTGRGPKARAYKQGQSPARANTGLRAKVLGSTAAAPPGYSTRFHMNGANFAAKPRGPKQIRFASPEQAETFYYGPYPLMASGGYGCIAAGTRIFDPILRQHRRVEEINSDFNVLALDIISGDVIPTPANRPFLKGHAELFEVITDFDHRIVVTDAHIFMSSLGWLTLQEIRSMSPVPRVVSVFCGAEYQHTSAVVAIKSIESLGEDVFYDLHVPIYENYLAEGFINHNSGKTFGLCLKAMYLSSMYPGNRGAIFRKHGNKLEKTTMKTFFKVCPPEAYQFGRRSDQAKTLVLNNGSEILWSQLDDSEILELLRGLEINWFLIDQAEEVSEEIIEVLMRRLGRWDQAEVPQHLIDAEHAAGREWPWRNEETGQFLPPTYAMFACLEESTLVEAEDGCFITIKEACESSERIRFLDRKTGESGFEPPSDWRVKEVVGGVDVCFSAGEIAATADHQFFRFSATTGLELVRADQLRPGDFIPSPRVSKPTNQREDIHPDMAYLLGYTVGDGNIYRRRIQWTERSLEQVDRVERLCRNLFGKQTRRHKLKQDAWYTYLSSKEVVEDLKVRFPEIAITGSNQKCVPQAITLGDASTISNFLSGLFDADGTAGRGSHLSFTTVSRRLAHEVVLLLERLGIMATLCRTPKTPNDVWIVSMTGDEAMRFQVFVGFRISDKNAVFQIAEGGSAYSRRCVPASRRDGKIIQSHQKTIPRFKLEEYPELDAIGALRFSWQRVKAVKHHTRRMRVYDLTMPSQHNFLANGVMVHNCNPDHELHWIYRRFHPESPEWKETYSKQGYKMIFFDSTKNIFLPEQNKSLLLQGTKEFVARFVRGEWGIPEGQIHKIDAMSLLRMTPDLEKHLSECKLSRTLDHGETSPTCCVWWALDRWGNLFAYREYYQPDRLISYHRQKIYEMSLRKVTTNIAGQKVDEWVPEQYTSEFADPSIFNPRTQRGTSVSVAQEYMEVNEESTDKHNAIFWDRADNNELGTRNRINELLALDPNHKHPLTKKLGAPRLYFIERTPEYPMGCFELIRETRSARRVKIGTQDGRDIFSDERDESIVDHSYDCFSGGTQVITPGGLVRFDELPEHGQVLTPRGWDYYFGAQKYRVDCDLVQVRVKGDKFSQDVYCTPDHLFMTKGGRWVPAAHLSGLQLDAFEDATVVEVLAASKGDSWCLTVDNTMHHSFCIEGGIVVHNCLRYRCADMDALPVEAIRRPGPGTVAHSIAEMKKESKRAARPRGDGTSRALDLARLPPQLASYYRRKVS